MHLQRFSFIFLVIFVISGCGVSKKAQQPKTSFDDGIRQINHVVVIYMENHSFDNLYGEFKGANGIENAEKGNFVQVDKEGKPYKYLPEIPRNNSFPTNLPNDFFNIDQYVTSDKKTPDVTHSFLRNQLQIDGGKMDKFAAYNHSKGLAMGYYSTEKLPLYPIAQKYTLCDNLFQSAFGGSYFNHVFLISAAVPVWRDAPKSMTEGEDPAVTSDGYAINTVYPKNPPYPPKSDTSKLMPPQTMPTIG
ncbi:MAG: alkaline phosphatase family protein, partial [Ginsengibacter sp.]